MITDPKKMLSQEINKMTMEENVTIVIKTFERPSCLKRLVKSIRQYYSYIKIIIVDDSREPINTPLTNLCDYYHINFDSGVSYGKNFGLKKVTTKYYLLCDDDLVFGKETVLEKMYEVLEKGIFSLVSCNYMDHFNNTNLKLGCLRFEGTIDIENGVLQHRFKQNRGYLDQLPIYDILHNFFMADTQKMLMYPWDERLKTCDHTDFFLMLKTTKILCTKLENVMIYHKPQNDKFYKQYRYERIGEFQNIWYQKHGINKLIYIGNKLNFQDRVRYFHNRCWHDFLNFLILIGRRILSYLRTFVIGYG